MKILLTGAAGFIGSRTSRRSCWPAVTKSSGIDNLNDYYDPNLKRARLAIFVSGSRRSGS